METDEHLTYAETSRTFNIPIGTLYALVCRRRIPHIRLGPRLVRFSRRRLEEWFASQEVSVDPKRGAK
jgi:excisionase family DNA binding protein